MLPQDAELLYRTTYVLLDKADRIIAALLPAPKEAEDRLAGSTWESSMERLADRVEESREALGSKLKKKDRDHRRGQYATLSTGVSYGGGQTVGVALIALSGCSWTSVASTEPSP